MNSWEPLAVVIQLESAEIALDYEAALSYLDKAFFQGRGEKGIEEWKRSLVFLNNLARDKRFTSERRYHQDRITVEVEGQVYRVKFFHKENPDNAPLVYTLERKNDRLLVTKISRGVK